MGRKMNGIRLVLQLLLINSSSNAKVSYNMEEAPSLYKKAVLDCKRYHIISWVFTKNRLKEPSASTLLKDLVFFFARKIIVRVAYNEPSSMES